MTDKISLQQISSGYASTDLHNENITEIERHLNEKVLYRDNPDGEANQMSNPLDMNSNPIINLPSAVSTSSPITLGQFNSVFSYIDFNGTQVETQIATASQTVFTLTTMTYWPGIDNLAVYVNGLRQPSTAYTETSTSVVTFATGLTEDDVVIFVANEITNSADAVSSSNVTFTQGGTGSITRNIQAKLQEFPSVKDFGAVGNGVADDTTAFQAAANLGTDITIPPGEYCISSPVIYKNGTRFHGAGHWGGAAGAADPTVDTIVKATASMDCVFRISAEAVGTEPTNAATRSMKAVGLTGVVVDGNNLADFGVYAVRANLFSHFERTVCINCKEYGFWGALLWTCTLKDILCRDNEKNGFGIGKNIYSWAGSTNCNNCTLINVSGQLNGTTNTFNEGVLEDEGIGVELYLHRGNTCISTNAEFNDGPGIYVQTTSLPNTFIGGYTENNGQSGTATAAWDLWFEGESGAGSSNVTFQGMIVVDDVRITGTEPSEAGAYSPLEFRDCYIDGDIKADWNNFKLLDTRHNGTFTDQNPIGRLMSVKIGDTLYKDARVQGVASAWGKIDGTGTPSITKGFNIASITDNGTGDYWVNFTNNMPSTDYCVVGSANNRHVGVQSAEVSRVRINVRDNAGTLTDDTFYLTVFSDD